MDRRIVKNLDRNNTRVNFPKLHKKFLAQNYPSNACAENCSKITIFQVGASGGLSQCKMFVHLEGYARFFFCDPRDSSSLDKHQQWVADRSEVHLTKRCIAKSCSKRTIHVNKAQSSNSLFPSNPSAAHYSFHRNEKELWGMHTKTVESLEIDTVTLDYLREQREIDECDVLVMDIQGAEYEVLQGAESYLDKDLLGVTLEVEMFPIYEGQGLFADTYDILSKHGFFFAGFWGGNLQAWFPYVQIGTKGFEYVGECIYLKDFRCLVEQIKDEKTLVLKLHKLARISFCFGYDAYGLEIINFVTQKYSSHTSHGITDQYIEDQIQMFHIIKKELDVWPIFTKEDA